MQNTEHEKYVDYWMEHAAKDVPVKVLLAMFEAAWSALRLRAESAVGEIALEAIAELVRAKGAEKYQFLALLKVEAGDISCKALQGSADALGPGSLQEGLRFLLVEFLTVIGELTDQVLSPALYDELSRIAQGSPGPQPGTQERNGAAVQALPEIKEASAMTEKNNILTTGIPNLDEMLAGGLIKGSSTAIAGPPGSGKTVLAQQIMFHNAAQESPAIFFSTLSEPGVKSLFYLKKFGYFDQEKVGKCIHFIDLGVLVRTKGLHETLQLVMERLAKLKPALVVIDSFKIFEEMAASPDELRKFSYELVVNLMARECTTLFLGEYTPADYERNPLFSIIDGLVTVDQRELSGERQRFMQIVKMRGLAHSRDEHTFSITETGIEVFAPRLTIKRSATAEPAKGSTPHCQVGIPKLDDLLGGGIPRGSSLLITGVAGTGKTVLGLEFVYRGAKAGEKGIVFSFEETDERLRAAARGLGWDLDAEIERGMVQIVFIPQPDIMVENHLLMMRERIAALGAARVTVDSLSVFLHKVKDHQIVREKVFQLASIIQNTQAVGFFATDIPYGSNQISRFGVEETVVDGTIILTSTEEGLERRRYIEVYKLRNTAHLKGRHSMTIGAGGINIFPRYRAQEPELAAPPPAKALERLSTGIDGLDELLGSGILARSLTLVSGSSGIGKSVLALQFVLEGAAHGEPGLYVTLEEGPEELIANAGALGLPLQKSIDEGLVDIVYLPPTYIRSTQLLTLLTDRIQRKGARRLALDSVTHLTTSGMSPDWAREQLYDLAVHIKNLGVTSVFTLESEAMYSTDYSTKRGFSPLADNVIRLRYVPLGNKAVSSLMVVKTRGSTHDNGLYSFSIAEGGVRLGQAIELAAPAGLRELETSGAGGRR